MARKIFISFLGAGNYKECVYTYDNKESKVVKYVQSASSEIFAQDFNKYFIFCTKKAFETHFKSLQKEAYQKFEKVDIPEGVSEEEIWRIFQIVFDILQENDRVIFDVTHSFRSIPMLGITLLQYAKFIKNIQVLGIYYGAFEKLGNPANIELTYPNPKDRKVPILDLTAFSALQDWSNAGSQFINTGNANSLLGISNITVNQILKETKGKNEEAKKIKDINSQLQKISEDFSTNRGSEFIKAQTIFQLLENINKMEGTILPVFIPILEKIKVNLAKFKENKTKENLFLAIKWCIDRGLTQQGITQLQEAVITILCHRLGYKIYNVGIRNIISSYLSFGIQNDESKWKDPLTTEVGKCVVSELKKVEKIKEIAKEFTSLTDRRNNINHGGFVKEMESKKFKPALEDAYHNLEKLI